MRSIDLTPDGNGRTTTSASPAVPPKPRFKPETITPAMAAKFLEKNFNNRRMATSLVAQYTRDMLNNDWKPIGDPIRFSPDGVLLDGQKRLQAVVNSGKSQEFMVGRNIPEDWRVVMDSGQKRSAAHSLQMLGLRDATTAVAIANKVIPWVEHRLLERNQLSNSQIEAFVTKFEDELHRAVQRSIQMRKGMGSRNSISGALYFKAANHFGEEWADEKFDMLVSGTNIPDNSAIGAYRRRVQNARNMGRVLTPFMELYFGVRSLNAEYLGQPLSTMQAPVSLTEDHFSFVDLSEDVSS